MAALRSVRRAVFAVLFTSIGMGGCVYVRDRTVRTPPDCPPLAVAPENAGRYTGALEAARGLSFSSDRTRILKSIAAKPDLDECDQLWIVSNLTALCSYSSDRTDVLKTLVRNPATTPRTKATIGKNLESLLSYSSERAEIAQLLVDRAS